jgi:two-component system cell cycle sensor histidine kinase/response regulator CckA
MTSIREAKEEWEETFDAIEDAIFLVNKTYTILRANKGLAKLAGKPLTDIIGRKCYELLHGIDHVPEFCPRPFVVKNCCSHTGKLWEPVLNRHLRIYYYPIVDKEGGVREVIHVMRDITEGEQARQEIEYLASVVRHSQDAIISTGLDCKVTSWNKAAEKIFGYTGKEAVGNFIDIIVPEEKRKECHLFVEEIGEGGKIERHETIRKTKDGRMIDAELTISPIKEREGKIIGVSFIVRDVTYQKQLEANLLQAQKMESIGTLAGGLAHDFNNLLMGIQGYASLMLLKIDPSHSYYDMLRKIEEQVESGADLTKQLLGFARAGRYEPKPMNLNELIDRSSRMFGRTKKEIVIHRRFERDLWTVEVDQGQMEQVFLNLYVNAWQAMHGGGNLYLGTSNVTLDESYVKPYDVKPGNYVKISVTDTGEGMDQKTQQRIFDPFFTTKEMGRGTGLGLASVYGIVRNHKGIITVYSEKGYGTTFNIYLPASEKAIIQPTMMTRDEIMIGTETILLVDDEEQVLDAATAMLEHLGYTVLAANGGEEGWRLYQENKDRIHLVILDIIMPGTGGGQVYDRIKALNPDVKVIISSGYSIDGKASKILERGGNSFIQKPFNITDLSHKIREVIESS